MKKTKKALVILIIGAITIALTIITKNFWVLFIGMILAYIAEGLIKEK